MAWKIVDTIFPTGAGRLKKYVLKCQECGHTWEQMGGAFAEGELAGVKCPNCGK